MLSSLVDNILPYAGLLGLNLTSLLGPGPDASAAAVCCSELRLSMGGVVFQPSHASYSSCVQSMWSMQNQNLQPACIVKPKNAQQISQAVSILSSRAKDKGGCKFTIRSGGHSPWGSSNIDGGITIDLGNLDDVALNEDRTIASIGAGNRWFKVYSTLEQYGVTVVGGRVSSVGVGGLLTGGGISFFSPKHGWAADNIVSYEVVLASGEIVEVSETTKPDLFWALKGGSSNFGIVTRFDLRTFALPENLEIWGGMAVHDYQSTLDKNLNDFVQFTKKAEDPNAALISTYGYNSLYDAEMIVNSYVYTDKVDDTQGYPGPFKAFQDTPNIYTTLRKSTHSGLTKELGDTAPVNFHQVFHTSTYANDKEFLAKMLQMSREAYGPIKEARNITWSLVLQPFTTLLTQTRNEGKGNTLGIRSADGNQVLTSVSVSWELASDSDRINRAIHDFYDKADALAISLGLMRDFQYLNYCSEKQDPIKSYGKENVARMREVSKKYDPEGVFQRLVSRGYKLYTREEMEGVYKTEETKSAEAGIHEEL